MPGTNKTLPSTESSNHPSATRERVRPSLRRVGARRPFPFGAHQALPRDRGEEDRGAYPPPRGRVRPPVREDPHPAALPRSRHC